MSTWPSTLPKPSYSGYAVNPQNSVTRSEMDSGTARQRNEFSAVPDKLTVSWEFSSAQMVTFRTFFKTTINRGADWFTATLDIGDGLASYSVRFVGSYTSNLNAYNNWHVGGNLEIIDA